MKQLTIVFLLIWCAFRAPAETNVFSVESFVEEALAGNPELKFYEAEIAAAKGERRTAAAWPNPDLSAEAGQKRVRERSGMLAGEGMAWSVSLMQPFEWPGRIGLRKAIANGDVELAHLGLERFRRALAARVRTLAFGLYAAQQKAVAANDIAERFKALREIVVQRDPAGITPLLETRVIEATDLTIQRKATEAALAAQSALLELNQLRGQRAANRITITPVDLTFRPADELEVLQTLAQTNNFELRVRTVELAQQGFRLALARNERYPSVAVGPSYSEEKAGDRERIIGLGITLPLPLWNRNGGSIEAARARELQAEAALLRARRETERQVAEAALAYEARLREIAKWRPDAAEHFRAAAELADRHYRLGAVPAATYIELQEKYLEAVESLLDTKREALEAAQNLELLTGLVTPLASTKHQTPMQEETK